MYSGYYTLFILTHCSYQGAYGLVQAYLTNSFAAGSKVNKVLLIAIIAINRYFAQILDLTNGGVQLTPCRGTACNYRTPQLEVFTNKATATILVTLNRQI